MPQLSDFVSEDMRKKMMEATANNPGRVYTNSDLSSYTPPSGDMSSVAARFGTTPAQPSVLDIMGRNAADASNAADITNNLGAGNINSLWGAINKGLSTINWGKRAGAQAGIGLLNAATQMLSGAGRTATGMAGVRAGISDSQARIAQSQAEMAQRLGLENTRNTLAGQRNQILATGQAGNLALGKERLDLEKQNMMSPTEKKIASLQAAKEKALGSIVGAYGPGMSEQSSSKFYNPFSWGDTSLQPDPQVQKMLQDTETRYNDIIKSLGGKPTSFYSNKGTLTWDPEKGEYTTGGQ